MKRLLTFYHQLKLLFPPIQTFDAELENLYQSDFRNQFYEQIKINMIIGTAIAFLFIIWDFTNADIAPNMWFWRFPLLIVGSSLWLYMDRNPENAKLKLFDIGLWATVVVTIVLIIMLISVNKAEYYARLYPGLLLVFAYLQVPFLVPITTGFVFCLATTFIMVILGILFSVPLGQLVGANFSLFFMGFIGAYSRYQIEIFARRSFFDKRNAQEKQLIAEQAIAERDIFLRNASHNLSQPMQALASYASTLEIALKNKELESINTRAENFTRLVDLLNDSFKKIMDISKINSGVFIPTISKVSVNEILANIQQQYVVLATKKGLDFKIISQETEQYFVCTDAVMLQQVIGNLVHNAIKYTNHGFVLIRVVETTNNEIELHIIDTGIGIEKDKQEKIFETFYKVDEKADGLGVGLMYVEKVINILPHHRLNLSSEINKGTDFCIAILIATDNYISISSEDKTIIESAESIKGKFILLIDDNKDVLDALSQQLASQGCKIEKAASVNEARQVLENELNAPDLIITDYKLGEGETAEGVVRCVKDFYEQTPPIMVITGEPFASERILGVDYMLLKKPINNTLLLIAITQVFKG